MGIRFFTVAAALLAVVLTGCGDKRPRPKTVAECKTSAVAAREASKADDAAKSAKRGGAPLLRRGLCL